MCLGTDETGNQLQKGKKEWLEITFETSWPKPLLEVSSWSLKLNRSKIKPPLLQPPVSSHVSHWRHPHLDSTIWSLQQGTFSFCCRWCVCVGGGSLFCLVKPFWFQQHRLWFSLYSGFWLAPCIQSQSPPCKAFTCWELAFLTENNLHQIRLLLYSKQLDVLIHTWGSMVYWHFQWLWEHPVSVSSSTVAICLWGLLSTWTVASETGWLKIFFPVFIFNWNWSDCLWIVTTIMHITYQEKIYKLWCT